MPYSLFCSARAHAISHFCPVDVREFLLTKTIIPCDLRIRVWTFVCQSDSYASFTDMSMNSKGLLVCSDCPFNASRCHSSSIANATNRTFLSAILLRQRIGRLKPSDHAPPSGRLQKPPTQSRDHTPARDATHDLGE